MATASVRGDDAGHPEPCERSVLHALDTATAQRVYLRREPGQDTQPPEAGLVVVPAQVVRRILKVASVQDRVIEIVASQLGVSKEQITPETSFINDLGADSLDTVELVMELEEEFEINIPDDAAEKIQTVGQAVEFIEKHQASGSAAG
jgi:acyl carrier protein